MDMDDTFTRFRLPVILPTHYIDPKHDQLLLFNIFDITNTSFASFSVSIIFNIDLSNTTSTFNPASNSNLAPIYSIPAINPPT